jgi:hypothetical protein
MSFFDEGDEPTRATRPRAARPRRPVPSGGGPRTPDEQTLLVRRAVAGGLALLVIILLIFGIKSCADNAKENALKDYNRNVSAVAVASVREVSEPFFRLLNTGGSQGGDLQAQVNQLRLVAEEQVKRAQGFDVPGDMKRAQADLLMVLNFRSEGLQKIADRIPSAQVQGRDNRQTAEGAVSEIAGEMEVFLASDVVYSQRVVPYIDEALRAASIGGQNIRQSRFLPDLGWLNVDEVAGVLGAQRAGGGTGASRTPAPGLHGHGLLSTSVGTLTLQPGGVNNRIPYSANPTFLIKFQNQGENDESNVVVRLVVKGAGKTISQRKTINQTKAGQPAQVSIPLGQAPPVGQPVTINVTIEAVPGEKNTDNNKSTYIGIFTR